MDKRNWWPTGWRGVALLVIGGVMLANLVSPAVAHIGTVTHLWNQHIKPKADARYLPGGVAPAGITLRGTYWMGGVAAGGFDLATSEISFGYRFAFAPTPHFISAGDTPPAECPGSANEPEAEPGHICVYEAYGLNVDSADVNGPPYQDGTTYPFGTRLWVRSAAAGDFWSMGTWAATSAKVPVVPAPDVDRKTTAGA